MLTTSPPANQKNAHDLTVLPLKHCESPHYTLQGGTHSLEAHCGPFAWQSNNTILFYFTPNSVSAFLYDTGD